MTQENKKKLKITHIQTAELFGYSIAVFYTWKSVALQRRKEWLQVCTFLINNNISSDTIVESIDILKSIQSNKDIIIEAIGASDGSH